MIAGIIVGLIIGEIVGGLIGWNIVFDTAYKDMDDLMSRMDGNDSLSGRSSETSEEMTNEKTGS